MRKRIRLIAAAFVFALPIGLCPLASASEPPPYNPTAGDVTAEEKAQQESPAFALAHRILRVAGFRDHDNGQRGFTSVGYEVPTETVDLWWKGRLDSDVASIVAAGRKRGVTVVVHPALRTLSATQDAMRRLAGPEMKDAGIQVVGFGPELDCSGIHVEILVPVTQRFLEGKDERAAKVRRLGEQITGIRILTVTESYKRMQPMVPRWPRPL